MNRLYANRITPSLTSIIILYLGWILNGVEGRLGNDVKGANPSQHQRNIVLVVEVESVQGQQAPVEVFRPCSAYCSGNNGFWPFDCADSIPNAVNYFCGPVNGGCYYSADIDDEGPVGYCVYKGPSVGRDADKPASEDCTGYCHSGDGIWPFGCAEELPNVETYFCGPITGCYYASSQNDEGPPGFCAYKQRQDSDTDTRIDSNESEASLISSTTVATSTSESAISHSLLNSLKPPDQYVPGSGCLLAKPQFQQQCSCNSNPTVSVYAACNKDNHPIYFDDINDIPNGACIHLVNGEPVGTSLTTCSSSLDCVTPLQCQDGMCMDDNGVVEAERLVTSCVSPKHTDKANIYSGCPFSDYAKILECHKYWLTPTAMAWKRYVQHNPLGKGDSYAWAYDEAVCADGNSGNHPREGMAYPWCIDQQGEGAVDNAGKITDTSCPCTVENIVAPLNSVPFQEQGFGTHMHFHVYDIMYPGYVPPTSRNNFVPVEIPSILDEGDDFYLKVVNEYNQEILVYMDAPPAREGEVVTGNPWPSGAKWDGWTGPTQKLRGERQMASGSIDTQNTDPWVQRITVAQNDAPSRVFQPRMRVNSDGSKAGGFYIPSNHHLRIHLANAYAGGGWYRTDIDRCPNVACFGPGTSLWVTRADAYTYMDRDPLLLAEVNINAFPKNNFANGTIWIDLSAVDGVNANMQLKYGKIDKIMSVPLFQE